MGAIGGEDSTTASAAVAQPRKLLDQERIMSEHRYKVGSRVGLSRQMSTARPGEYKVVRLLPPEGNDFQYRVRNKAENVERVVKEYQLQPWRG